MAVEAAIEPWRRRLYLPTYQVAEAAKYAEVSRRTVTAWQKAGNQRTLSLREDRAALSYMQLIEVAVVAALRGQGIPLRRIRDAREYIKKMLESEYPFAEYRFKHDGKRLFMDYEQVIGSKGKGKLLRPDQQRQLAWNEVIGRLEEFEYERKKIVVKWHVAGPESPIIIDPRVCFGAPAINGTPTWVLKGRWEAGEGVEDIAEDFDLDEDEVNQGLTFEGISIADGPPKMWTH